MLRLYYLSPPTQEKRPDVVKACRPKFLETWLKELPTVNHSLTTRLLHDKIRDINSTKMDAAVRLESLEILQPQFLAIYENLYTRILGSGYPLSEKEQKIGELLLTITHDFTVGYFIALTDLSQRSLKWRQRRHIPLVLQRLMRGLSRILLGHYLMRLHEPDWIWLDLHSIFRLALKKKKLNEKIKDKSSYQLRQISIAETYKQIVLLSLADPYGLLQKEILDIYISLEKWGPLAKLSEGRPQGGIGHCLIDLDEDRSPAWYPNSESIDVESLVYHVDLDGVLKLFDEHKNLVDPSLGRFEVLSAPGEHNATLTLPLIEYLEDRWSGKPSPGMVFEERKAGLLAVGLKAIHQHLNLNNLREEKIRSEWLVTPISDKALCCDFELSGQLHVGSLVSLKRVEMEKGKRLLGVISRVIMRRMDGTVQFETTEIAPQVMAAGVQPLESNEPMSVYQRALIFKGKVGSSSKTYIVLSSPNLENSNTVKMLTHNSSYPIKLEDRRNVGVGYSLFECEEVMAKEEKDTMPKTGYDFL